MEPPRKSLVSDEHGREHSGHDGLADHEQELGHHESDDAIAGAEVPSVIHAKEHSVCGKPDLGK